MPMMTTTISSSIRVKPLRLRIILCSGWGVGWMAVLCDYTYGNARTTKRENAKALAFSVLARPSLASVQSAFGQFATQRAIVSNGGQCNLFRMTRASPLLIPKSRDRIENGGPARGPNPGDNGHPGRESERENARATQHGELAA